MADQPMCTCTHPVIIHHLTPSRIRTYCTHMDHTGPCPCNKAVEVSDGV